MTRYDFRFFILPFTHLNSIFLVLSLVVSAFSQDEGRIRSVVPDIFELSKAKGGCCGASADRKTIEPLSSLEYETYKLTATYFSLRGNLTATLMLNNKGPQPINATPTFYSLAGTRLQLAAISVPATSYIDVDMHQLLAGAGDEFREGSLKISYQGISQQLGAQVKLVDSQNSLIWAEQLSYTTKYVSSRLESVWWLPYENSETRVVISNTSSGIVTAAITADGTSPHQSSPATISLNPWETRVLDIMSDIGGYANGDLHEKGGVSISHTGNPGAVIARIFIAKPNKGYSSAINFIDPEATVSSRWHGNGLRLRNVNDTRLDPVLVARNTGDQPSTIQGKLYYTRPNGSQGFVVIPQRTISANSTRIFELNSFIEQGNVPNSVAFGGIELDYDSPKGTIITAVQSVSQNGNHVFQVPMFDPQNLPSSAGGFPWKVDGDFTTVVYIKNETDQSRKYSAHLKYPGGVYSLRESEIAPHQTIAVDFRSIRDSQTLGVGNSVIPLDIANGQIGWSMIGNANKVLSARSEQISLNGAVASTYSCANCCPSSRFIDTVNPPSASIGPNDNLQFFTIGIIQDCMGGSTPFEGGASAWASSNSFVASVTSSGWAEGESPGDATVTADWMNFSWLDAGQQCWYNEYPGQGLAPVSVVEVILTKADGSPLPAPLRLGISATTISGDLHGPNAHLHDRKQGLKATVTPPNQAVNVTIEPSSKITVTNIQRNGGVITFDVVGNSESATASDSVIRAKHAGTIRAFRAVSVVVPSKVATPHDTMGTYVAANRALDATTSPSFGNVPSGQVALCTIYARFLTIVVKDQFNALVGEVYAGAEVTETIGASNVTINQPLTSSSSYSDPVGGVIFFAHANSGSSTAMNWPSQPLQPLVNGTFTQNIGVQVDGFILVPGIAGRTWTATPPNTLTISWPN